MPKVMMLGGLRTSAFGDAASPLALPGEAYAPPSSYAIYDLVQGTPGALPRVLGLTLKRSLFILPGLALAGVRGWKLVTGPLLASVTITIGMAIFYKWKFAPPPAPGTNGDVG